MILEALRMIADGLADPTDGLVAMLALLPRDAGDPVPAGVDLYDETRNAQVAWGRPPAPSHPGYLIVTTELARDGGNIDASLLPPIQEGQLHILHRIWRSSSAITTANNDLLYVQRALMWSLNRLAENTAHALKVRNYVGLVSSTAGIVVPLFQPLEDVQVLGGYLMTWRIRDLKPTGI